jgi:rare lipoprotein A
MHRKSPATHRFVKRKISEKPQMFCVHEQKKTYPGFLFRILVVCWVFFFITSCKSIPPGIVLPPQTDFVTASWYGPNFHGRPTASGEKFNMYAMTCAHKKYPFGTRLKVIYLKTGQSAVVTVNDRGPFIRGRDLDLSYAAAKKTGLITEGVGRVKIEYLGRDMRYVRRISPAGPASSNGPFTIQVGSFKKESNASYLQKALRIRYKDVYITSVSINGQKFYRVRIGNFKLRKNAYDFAKILADEGYSIFIARRNGK